MFGLLAASPQLLSEEELSRYKAAYCGLCRNLGTRYGSFSRLTLNYDMTFLILLLNALYEPEERSGENGCVEHPFRKRSWWQSEITDYAADMNIALSYQKLLDDWKDDGKLSARTAAAVLKRPYEEVKLRWPRQCDGIEREIAELSELEKKGIEDPDAASMPFGRLMGEVFIFRDDRWKNVLYNLGCNLGRTIYLLDAVLDLKEDLRKERYNPFRSLGDDSRNESYFRDVLKLFLGDTVAAFAYLPIVQDAGLLKNILCFGLWQNFEMKYHPPEKGRKRPDRTDDSKQER